MRRSQLISVFLELTGVEKRELNKFVASPFFNQRKEVTDLWRYLVDYSKEGSTAFKKERVFESVFQGKEFDDKLLRHVSSWLLRCIEEYLAYVEYKSTPVKETLHKARAYKHKKQEKYFQKSIRVGEQQLEKMNPGLEFYYFEYSLKFEQYNYVDSRNRGIENNLRSMNQALDKYLLMSKLKQACFVNSHQSVFTTKYDFQLVELLLTFLENSSYLKEPSIACYYYCYRAISENNTECFQLLKSTLQQHQYLLAPDDLKYLYFSSINFCIRKINTGINEYRREVFDLYKSGLREGLLIENGELSRFTYNNIVSAALAFEEFEWLENFIPDYKPMLDPRHRESNYIYSLAKLDFTRKNYDQAMTLLLQIDERDLLLNADAKIMLVKIYFERNEYDALSSLLSSTMVWLGRKKILSYHKKHYQNFIRFTGRILHLTPRDKKAYEKLKKEIQEEKEMGSKDWLLEQLG
ncbi:MAG: hypothetical protein ACI8YQ_001418 [Polaribacter sp.]|jgi:hypothetical protein